MNDFSALIVITSCKRLDFVKNNIWRYYKFVNTNSNYCFLLSLDGTEQDYIEFAEEYQIPLLYSDEREGVGLSKNRVLKKFNNFDYYFFIEDDVYIQDFNIFKLYIEASCKEKIHHLSLYGATNIIKTVNRTNYNLIHSMIGGAHFNFFTREGLNAVGGWNTVFAKYKRFGHTEHTYRFYHQELQSSPFISIKEALNMILVFDPPHVSKIEITINENGLCSEEQELISQKTKYCQLETLSSFHFNNMNLGFNKKMDDFLNKHKNFFPLSKGKDRSKLLAEFYALRIPKTKNPFKKILFFFKSFFYAPTNVALKHYLKTKIFGK